MDFYLPTLNAGEISDLLAGRTDIQARSYGGATVENFIPLVQGPIASRPGVPYINSVYNSAKKTHVIGMNTASQGSYVVEFSEYIARFFKSGALIQGGSKAVSSAGGSSTITCTSASPAVITWTNHGLPLYASVRFTNSGGALPTGISAGVTYYVKTVTKNTFTMSATPNGTAINTSSTGTGTHTGYHNIITTSTSNGFNNNDVIRFSGVTGSVPLLNGDWAVKNIAGDYATVTFTLPGAGVSDKVNWTSHGLVADDQVQFVTTATLPANLSASTTYYVVTVVDANTFSISDTKGGTEITNTTAGSGTHAGRQYTNQKQFELYSIGGNVDFLSGSVVTSSYTALAGSPVVKFIGKMTPYSESNLFDSNNCFDVGHAVIGDTMFLSHKNYWPQKLLVNSDTDWEILPHESYQRTLNGTIYHQLKDGPWDDKNIDSALLVSTTSFADNNVGTVGFLDGKTDSGGVAPVFVAADTGRLVRIEPDRSSNTGVISTLLTSFTSTNRFNAEIVDRSASSSDRHLGYRKSLFHPSKGYPHRISFYQDRACYANMEIHPTRVEMSESGNYESFSPTDRSDNTTIPDSAAISFSIPADGVGKINWTIGGGKSLLCGCSGGVFSIAGSTSTILVPGKIASNTISTAGAHNIPALQVNGGIYYIENGGTKLRLAGSVASDVFENTDITRLNPNILDSGAIGMVFSSRPYPIIWIWRTDGKFVSLTVDEGEKISSFARHKIGGTYSSGDAVVESMAVVKSSTYYDEVWMVVKRTINGSTVRYVERMSNSIYADYTVTQNTAVCSDGSYVYNSTPVTNIPSGACNHLIGESVDVVADGLIVTGRTINGSGQLSSVLASAASVIIVGLAFRPKFETTNLENVSQTGLSTGKRKRINQCDVGFYRTLGGKIGRDSSNMNDMDFGAYTTSVQPLFTGVKKLQANGIETETARVRIEQTVPAPMCITFLNAKGETHG